MKVAATSRGPAFTGTRTRSRASVASDFAVMAPVVEVVPHPDRSSSLLLMLHATLELDHLAEPVSFPLVIDERGGTILVATEPDDGPAGSD